MNADGLFLDNDNEIFTTYPGLIMAVLKLIGHWDGSMPRGSLMANFRF
jgi:hypothetical protein